MIPRIFGSHEPHTLAQLAGVAANAERVARYAHEHKLIEL